MYLAWKFPRQIWTILYSFTTAPVRYIFPCRKAFYARLISFPPLYYNRFMKFGWGAFFKILLADRRAIVSMANKKLKAVTALLAAAMVCLPVNAASVVNSDVFAKNAVKPWETDQKDPEKWDTSQNYLSITVGGQGSFSVPGSSSQRGGAYDLQGKKLKLERPASASWTASVKLNADEGWFSSAVTRRTAVFRLDLVDAAGNPLDTPAALALEKRSGSMPVWACINPELVDGWSYPKLYTGTSSGLLRKELEVEEGWRTLYIKCDRGNITYQVDGKVIGGFDLGVSEAYPDYAALGAADPSSHYTVDFDNFYLFNGNVGAVKKILTEQEEEERESSQEEKYRDKRERWRKNHTEYLIYQNGEEVWVRGNNLTQDQIDNETYGSRIKGDMPDSYWDY